MYDVSDRVIPVFLKKLKKNQNIEVFGRKKFLDFTYIDDAVDAIFMGIKKFDFVKNNTFNISYGKGISIINVAKYLIKKLNSKSKIKVNGTRAGEVVSYVANIKSAKKKMNFFPKTNIKNGLNKTINWYIKNIL